MPRLLSVGHLTRDSRPDGDVLGGTASYAALAALRLGWEAAVLTSAGPELNPERELPGVEVFLRRASSTTRFVNEYDGDGGRRQVVTARADDLDFEPLPSSWYDPEALLLGPVAGELFGISPAALAAGCVGAVAQGYLRSIGPEGRVATAAWTSAARDLLGVHVLFLSERDLPDADARAHEWLSCVPIVAVTRGWRGASLFTREGRHEVPAWPRPEVDPTGAGDVFAAAFLMRYQESGDPLEAAAFGACAASCVVEGVGTSALGDRAEVERRLVLRERLIEEGEWEE